MMEGSETLGHPRPDHRRESRWWSLDGSWDFFPDQGYTVENLPEEAPTTIRVPYAWETAASGVHEHWLSRAWYRREVALPPQHDGQRLVLHFGAVHHATQVWLDGRLLITHVGGQSPFEVDITDAVTAGQSCFTVRVDAPVDKGEIPHGKQRSIPADPYDSCSFTPCSGIWQSVWLEERPVTFVDNVELKPLPGLDGFRLRVSVGGPGEEHVQVHARILGTDQQTQCDESGVGVLTVRTPKLWSPSDPHLYVVEVELRHAGSVVDRLLCTSGLRSVAVSGAHLFLNGERCYLRGVLDQGYWPAHGWTAPSEQALIADLQAARDAGFTLVRKHLKLEDPRWLHHADRLGMLVWEEPSSTSRFSEASVAAFESQIRPMVTRDQNHPSIVIWGLYNEEWGLDWDVANDRAKQRALSNAYVMIKQLDQSRPVIDNSGWSHVRSDLSDWHVYSPDHVAWAAHLKDLSAGGQGGFVVDLGPAGPVRKYVNADGSSTQGMASLNSEYGTGRTSVERAWLMRWQTQELRRLNDLNGYVYTELYDIEHETAGLLTDHRQPKDGLGLLAANCHRDTVIVIDVAPLAPGCDLICAPDGEFALDVRVSHHGRERLVAQLGGGWQATLSSAPPPATVRGRKITADPFLLSESVVWHDRVPEGVKQGRLHLWVIGSAGDEIARTVLDICRG